MSKYEHKSAKDKAFEKERIQFRHQIHDLKTENKQLSKTIREQTDTIETLNDQLRTKNEWIERLLTRREQEIPYFYKWWDELRLTRRFLDFRILLYYNVFTNQSYLTERI